MTVINPVPEREVRDAMARRQNATDWRKVAKGIVAIFAGGLMVGSCVAGVMVPVKFVQWIFGG